MRAHQKIYRPSLLASDLPGCLLQAEGSCALPSKSSILGFDRAYVCREGRAKSCRKYFYIFFFFFSIFSIHRLPSESLLTPFEPFIETTFAARRLKDDSSWRRGREGNGKRVPEHRAYGVHERQIIYGGMYAGGFFL